jgi:hypothetical protein
LNIIKLINTAENIVSSVLSILETERALMRAGFQNIISQAEVQRQKGQFIKTITAWSFLEITPEIRARAAQPFPMEPIRSLDSIHLATMLEFLQIYPDLEVISFDKRILDNVYSLGLKNAIIN